VAKLRPLKVGSKGQLLEWDQEFEECDPHHRHQSHMFALYPGRQITAEGTPDLFAACQRSMEFRGDGGTGWSMGWKVAIWARLRDGDHALKMLGNFFKLVPSSVHVIYTDGGIYPNLLCAHPPFQIDGNFGAAAGIAEMLLQSHAGELHLLPALPGAWRQGRVRGLRARGAIEVDIAWRDGRLLSATLRAAAPGKHRLRYGDKSVSVELRPGEEVPFTLDDF
jgi:alpha-L-fucosidase 2